MSDDVRLKGLPRVADHWRLPCEGLVVGQLRIDFAFGIEFTEALDAVADMAWRLRIETELTLDRPNESPISLDPQGERSLLGPALGIFREQLVEGGIWDTGRLRLRFANDFVITVEPQPQYEAWQLYPEQPEVGAMISPLVPDRIDWGPSS